MSVLHKFFKDTVIYGFASVVPRLMNFLLVRLHTSVLEPGNYAINTSFYIYAAFFNVLLTYGMETAFFRYFNRHKHPKKVFTTVLIALLVTTVCAYLILLLLGSQISTWLALDPYYFRLLSGLVVLDLLVVAPFAWLRANGKSWRFAGVKLANISIFILLNVLFLWIIPKYKLQIPLYQSNNLEQYIFIANLAAGGFTLLLLLPLYFKFKWKFSKVVFKQLWHYSWPIMIAGVAYIINENLDKLLLERLISKELMGAYAGCYKLAVIMTLFIQAFRLGAEPFFFQFAKDKRAPETYALILKYFVITGCFILIVVVGYLDFFKKILVPNAAYWHALAIVPVVLLANLFLGIYHNLSVWYKLTDQTRYGMYISILGALVTIVLNLLLIPLIGFMAAAWATLAAYSLMTVVSYAWGRKQYPIPYDLKKILLYLVLATAISCLCFMLFKNNYILPGFLIAAFLALVLLLEGKELIAIIKKTDSGIG